MDGSRKAVIAALLANAGLAVAKFVAFALTGAASMLAEGVHSVADSGNQGLLLLGAARAQKDATEEHPFGYGRERYFWAFVVSLVLFFLGGAFAISEGISKINHPHPLESPMIAVSVLLTGILLEGFSFRTAIIEARRVKGTSSWSDFIRHTKSAELPVILLEDLGALVGLALALLGIALSVVTGDTRFDGAGSISIGVLLCCISVILAVEMRSLLVGEAASSQDLAKLRAALLDSATVHKIIHMRTNHIGPEQLLVGVKLVFDGTLSFEALAEEIDAAERRAREALDAALVIYIEPDVDRSADPESPAAPGA